MTIFRSFYTPFLLLVALLLTSCIGIAKADLRIDPKLTIFEPIDFTKLALIPAASKAHQRECQNESERHYGLLTIDHTTDIDVYRCIRWVQSTVKSSGTFKLDAVDIDFHQVGFPYLTWVSSNLIIDGQTALDEAYFPRLSWVGGSLIFHLSDNVEYVDTPALKKAKNLTVNFRENNVDLNGQNALTELDTLILNNGLTENAPFLNGLQKLTTLKNYKINGGDVTNYTVNNDLTDGGFLESLTTMDGNITIDTVDMSRLYGLGNITTVNGDITIRNPNNNSTSLNNLQGMENVETINGTLKIQDVDSLSSLTGLGKLTVDHLILRDNGNLANVSALNNISITNYGSVRFEGLSPASCQGISQFINTLHYSVDIYNYMTCQ